MARLRFSPRVEIYLMVRIRIPNVNLWDVHHTRVCAQKRKFGTMIEMAQIPFLAKSIAFPIPAGLPAYHLVTALDMSGCDLPICAAEGYYAFPQY